MEESQAGHFVRVQLRHAVRTQGRGTSVVSSTASALLFARHYVAIFDVLPSLLLMFSVC